MTLGNITVIGSLNIDHIFFVDRLPLLGESYEAKDYKKALGGKGANAAIATYRSCHTNPDLGEPRKKLHVDTDIKVRMKGAVGDDTDGTWMRDMPERAKVDVSGVRTETAMTGMTFIIVEEPDVDSEDKLTRDNRLIYTIGANATLKPTQFADVTGLSNGVQPDLIISQLEIARETVEAILKTAHGAGIKVLLNAAPANVILPEFYQYVTHLLVNETEAAMLYGWDVDDVKEEIWPEMATFFLEAGVENFVITLGEKGAFFARLEPKSPDSKQREVRSGTIDAFPVDKVIDPTGAG
jgi:ribokinase